ncbi:MAG: enoyl-CoA hydratase/isomerase family protein [Sphingobium sp.]
MTTSETAPTETIGVERRPHIAIVTINNPARRNAFTPDMRRALTAALTALNKDPEVRCVVLTGAGDHFCVGADVSKMDSGSAAPRTTVQIRENTKEVHQLIQAILTAPKPYIAAVAGDAFGGGMGIAVGCDFVVAGPKARFGTAFAKIGLLPEFGMFHLLPQRVGMAQAKKMMMLADPILAEDAMALGLADELVPEGALHGALRLAEQLASRAPLSVGYIKLAYADGVPSVARSLRMELDLGSGLSDTEDFREGIAALREKRAPDYKGR